MVAVGGDDVIIVTNSGNRAGYNCFLPDVKMTKTADLLRLILLAGAFLKAPNQQHQREHLDFVALLHYLHRRSSSRNRTQPRGTPPRSFPASPQVHANHKQKSENQITEDRIAEEHPGWRGAILRQSNCDRLNKSSKSLGVTGIVYPRHEIRDEIEDH